MKEPTLRIRETISRPLSWALGLIPPLLLLGGWWFVTHPRQFEKPAKKGAVEKEIVESRILSPVILPSPRETLQGIRPLWFDRELSRSAVFSLRRVCGGYLLAVALAVPLGILMGSFTKIKATFNPLTVAGTYLPLPALGVLMLPWAVVVAQVLRAESLEVHKYIFLAVVTFVVLLPQVVLAIENVEDIYLQTAYTQGASRWDAVTKVLVPVALPELFTALRASFAIGWTYIILAEIIAAERGLGHLIQMAQRRGEMQYCYLVVLTIMIIGYGFDKLWVLLGRRLLPYQTVR
jgi:NitT/TauT family transport system permease protein